MKKIYLSLPALFLAVGSFAQGGNIPLLEESAVKVKQTITEKPAHHVNWSERGSCVYTNDFSTSSDWTIGNTIGNGDNWVIGTAVPAGSFPIAGIASTTAGNGFALYDSDLMCSGSQDGYIELATPLNLSSDPAVAIRFESYYRKYQGTCWVDVSADGSTWTSFEVHSTLAVNDATASNPVVTEVNVSSVIGGEMTAYIRFRYNGGCDYSWMIDDMCVTTPPSDEVSMLANSFGDNVSGINYYGVPDEQSANINNSFMATITNAGVNAQAGSVLEATIEPAGGGAAVATLLGTSTTMNAGDIYEDSTTTSWNLGSTIGDFNAIWKADYAAFASDDDNSNNYDTAMISVTDFIYSRDRNDFDYDGGGLWNGDDGAGNTNGYVMANLFDIYTTADLTGIDIAFNGSTPVGALVKPQVYEVDGSGNFALIYDAPADYVITGADVSSGSANWVTIPIDPSSGGQITLTAGMTYLVGFEHYGGPSGVYPLAGGNAPEQTVFLYDPNATTGGPWFFMTSTPSIRANFDPTLGVNDVEATNLTLGQNAPNPFDGNSIINYSLNEAAAVSFQVTDVTGKVISTQNLGKVAPGAYTMDLNAGNYAKGVYFYSMTAGKEKLTRRMVITK